MLVLLALHITLSITAWLMVRQDHKRNMLTPGLLDVLLVIIPFTNIAVIIAMTIHIIAESSLGENIARKFFRL